MKNTVKDAVVLGGGTAGWILAAFLKQTKATIKLGIMFENWYEENHSYFHSFGIPGKDSVVCQFHHYLKKSYSLGNKANLSDYDLNYLCAMQGKFAKINSKDPLQTLPYAYHFDATLYALFLRKLSEKIGFTRVEGKVEEVIKGQNNSVKSLKLESGKVISGDSLIVRASEVYLLKGS